MEIEWKTLRKILEYGKPEVTVPMANWFFRQHPDKIDRFAESISENQLRSKENLFLGAWEAGIKPLTYDYEDEQISIEIIGGWFGFPLLDWVEKYFGARNIKQVRFFELDRFCLHALDKYLTIRPMPFDIAKYNVNWFDYTEKRRAHVIINTSCEHMPDLGSMKKYITDYERTTLFLTSNDKTDEPDHVNCVDSVKELAEKNELKMLWADSLRCEVPISEYKFEKYYRHQVIGRWK